MLLSHINSDLGCNTVFSVQMSSGTLRIPSIHGCDQLKDIFLWNINQDTMKAAWINVNTKAEQFVNGEDVAINKWKGHLLKLVSSCDPTKCAVLKVGGGTVSYPFDVNQLDAASIETGGNTNIKITLGGGFGTKIKSAFDDDFFSGFGDWFKDFNLKK